MDYHVEFDALDQFYKQIQQETLNLRTQIQITAQKCRNLSESEYMSGTGADNIRSYFESVHTQIHTMLIDLIELHHANSLVYKQHYQSSIDQGLHAVIDQGNLRIHKNYFTTKRQSVNDIDSELSSVLRNISDIFWVDRKAITDVDNVHDYMINYVTTLSEDMGDLEDLHKNSDFQATEYQITTLKNLLLALLDTDRSYKTDFNSEDFFKSEVYNNAKYGQLLVQATGEQREELINACLKNEEARKQNLQIEKEMLEQAERAEKAKWMNIAVGLIVFAGCLLVPGGIGAAVLAGAIGGALISGTKHVTGEWVETGEWGINDWGEFAYDMGTGAIIGGTTSGISKGVSSIFTQFAKPALESTDDFIKIGSNALIGSTSSVIGGVGGRTLEVIVDEDLDFDSLEGVSHIFDPEQVVNDTISGAVDGVKDGLKKTEVPDAPDSYKQELEIESQKIQDSTQAYKQELEMRSQKLHDASEAYKQDLNFRNDSIVNTGNAAKADFDLQADLFSQQSAVFKGDIGTDVKLDTPGK